MEEYTATCPLSDREGGRRIAGRVKAGAEPCRRDRVRIQPCKAQSKFSADRSFPGATCPPCSREVSSSRCSKELGE